MRSEVRISCLERYHVQLTGIRLLMAGNMDCVPFFRRWMIEKVGAAIEVESSQLILGPMLKALPKFGRRFGEFRGAIGLVSTPVGSEVCGFGRERSVSCAQEAVDLQRLRSSL